MFWFTIVWCAGALYVGHQLYKQEIMKPGFFMVRGATGAAIYGALVFFFWWALLLGLIGLCVAACFSPRLREDVKRTTRQHDIERMRRNRM